MDHLEEESGCNFVAVYIYRINAPEEEKTACWCAQLLQAQGVEEGGEGAGTVPKRRRLSAIGAMADEPVQSWLDNLPRDDLAPLLYGRLPTIFGLSKTDTAAVVGEVLHKNERTIRRWGRPNLTAGAFCQWLNNELLPNTVLDPGYPRSVSVETARKWLHDLGFYVLQMSKGVFIDGHERPDVVESRENFLGKILRDDGRQCCH